MKCPECGEANEAGMLFCINCGHTLSASAPQAASSSATPVVQTASIEELQASTRQTSPHEMVLVCTVCNKTDPLNGQFCVYCGGRTIAGPAPLAATSAPYNISPAMATSQGGAAVSPDSIRFSGELARSPQPQAAPRSSNLGPIIIFLSIVLGAGIGFGTVYSLKEDIQKKALKTYWPAEGLLVFSEPPNTDLRISDARHKSILVGHSSATGTIHLSSISPGNYSLKLSDGLGKESSSDFTINSGEHTVLGYPERLQLR